MWVTFVNGDEKYRDLMINWAYHLRAVNVPHIVVAFDDVAAGVCQEKGIPYLRCAARPFLAWLRLYLLSHMRRRQCLCMHNTQTRIVRSNSSSSTFALQPISAIGSYRHVETLVSGDFRADFSKFRKMGSNKPLIVLRLLERHAFDTVIISDVDTAWLRDPGEFVLRHPTADVLISTDCLSHWLEAQHDPQAAHRTYFHRCGHLPGATYGRAFNTGVIIFRNRYVHTLVKVHLLGNTRIAPLRQICACGTPHVQSVHDPTSRCAGRPRYRYSTRGERCSPTQTQCTRRAPAAARSPSPTSSPSTCSWSRTSAQYGAPWTTGA